MIPTRLVTLDPCCLAPPSKRFNYIKKPHSQIERPSEYHCEHPTTFTTSLSLPSFQDLRNIFFGDFQDVPLRQDLSLVSMQSSVYVEVISFLLARSSLLVAWILNQIIVIIQLASSLYLYLLGHPQPLHPLQL